MAAFFRQRGLPAAVWSTIQSTAHMPDEWTSLKALVKDTQVLALLYAGLYYQALRAYTPKPTRS